MKIKLLLPFISIFFIVFITFYFYNLYYYAEISHGWIIGDWLINFQAGFVRRGLSGYLIIALSDILKLKPNFTTMWVQLIIQILFLFLLLFQLYRKKINIWFLILLFSPVTIRFPILGMVGPGRKEIIILLLFILFLICLNRKLINSSIVIPLFSLLLMVATLFHELVFFYTPYFILASYLHSKINEKPFYFSKSLYLSAGSLLIMIAIYFFGRDLNGPVICAGLIKKGLSDNVCKGILSFPKNYGIKDVVLFARQNNYFKVFSASLFLGIVPFLLFVNNLDYKFITPQKFLSTFLILLLFSAPLFMFSIDWDRWIHIHFILLLLTSTLFAKDYSLDEKLIIPRMWRSKRTIFIGINNIIFFLIWLLYITIWSMPHCGSTPLFNFGFLG